MYFPIYVDAEITLELFSSRDAERVWTMIQANRANFDQWLRWTGKIQSLEDLHAHFEFFQKKWLQKDGFHAGIWYKEHLVGGLACHGINRESQKTEIGYWLDQAARGQGLVTRACRTLLVGLFEDEKLHRVEIQCAVENFKSRAVAERLGFKLEGIKRESEWLSTRYADHALYSLLDYEWFELTSR
jgi:ribosomal-protein-serine acetyltransferase